MEKVLDLGLAKLLHADTASSQARGYRPATCLLPAGVA
jgi:hypothetical protein